MKDILSERLGADVRSINVDGGKIRISLPNIFLNKVVEESYGEKTDSVRIENGEVEVRLSDCSEITEDSGGRSFGI